MRHWMREQRILCSQVYQEVDIIPIKPDQVARGKKECKSSLAQQRLNDRNAARYLNQLIAANFVTHRCYLMDPTYKPEKEPKTMEEADRNLVNYLRRVKAMCKKRGLPNPKYIAVTEQAAHFHHHIILDCGLTRDELEDLWSTGRGARRERLGRINCDVAQPEHGALAARARYMVKTRHAARRWRQSTGLKKPERKKPNDGKYTRRAIDRAVRNGNAYDPRYWEQKYPTWKCHEIQIEYNPIDRAPYVRLTLWRPRSPYIRAEARKERRRYAGR